MPSAFVPSASVYFRKDSVFLHPQSRTTEGVYIAAMPAFRLPRETSPHELVAAARKVLANSRQDVVHPTEWKGFAADVLAVAGVRSWMALHRSASLCRLEQEGDRLVITPYRNGGTRGDGRGYHELGDRSVRVSWNAPDKDLAAAFFHAEKLCT